MAAGQPKMRCMTVSSYLLLALHNTHDAHNAALIQPLLQVPSGALPSEVRVVQTLDAALNLLNQQFACAALLLEAGIPNGTDVAIGQMGKLESVLVERLLHDALTGLPRRRLLVDRLAMAMKRCARDGSSGTLLVIHLDRFGQLSQTHGAAAADLMLSTLAQRLAALVRDSDTVARLADHEFAVLLPNESGLLEAFAVGEKLMEALRRPLVANGQTIAASATIGVGRFRDASEPADQMMQRAEAAMHAATDDNKGRVRLL